MKILLIAFLLISVQCEQKQRDKRVIGGEKCSTTTHKYIVSLIQKQHPVNFCGGSLIKLNWVLTSAHCVLQYVNTPSEIRVAAGVSLEKPLGTQVGRPNKIIVDLNATSFGIGLILLTKPFEQKEDTDVIEMISKKVEGEMVTFCDKGTVSGWGVMEEKPAKKSKKPLPAPIFTGDLHCVEIPILSERECNNSRKMLPAIPPDSFCAFSTDGVKDTCNGDLGGPFVCNNVLVGVVSYGMCATPRMPSIYARVDVQLEFIQKTIENTKLDNVTEEIATEDNLKEEKSTEENVKQDTTELNAIDDNTIEVKEEISTELNAIDDNTIEVNVSEENATVDAIWTTQYDISSEVIPKEEEVIKPPAFKPPELGRSQANNMLSSIMLLIFVAMCAIIEL